GVIAYNSIKVQNFPDLDVPNITITASLPGASPGQMETDVARKIENAIASINGLKNIYTKVQDGVATITAEFRLEKDTQEALDEVRSAVSQVRADLPGDLRDPVINKLNLSGAPVLAYTIASSQMDDEALSWFVDDTISRKLIAVKGVGAVTRVGGVNREVRVALDAGKMQSLGVTASQVSRQLSAIQMDTAGGRTNLGSAEQPVRTLATVKSAQELAQMEIALGDASPTGGAARRVRLDQVATVQDTIAEPRSAALLNGKPVVGFEITRSKGASEVEAGRGVRTALEELKKSRPDLQITEAFDFVTPVEEEYSASLTLLIEGALLAVLVVWLFLRDWRATIVSSIALPLSVIPAFIGMAYLGFSINVVTLLALSLVIGILVDDAIVEVENIERHIRMGKTPYQAAMEAADEIGLAVIATTFTLIAVFLPTAFMSGIAGKFFKQFGWTAALAVFASLVVARMLTPMMAAYMMKGSKHSGEDGRIMRTYMKAAAWCVKHRWWTALGAALFFVGSLSLIPLLPSGFIPPDDNSQTQVNIELPPGSKLADTVAAAEAARVLVSKVEHVKSIYTTIGGGAAGSDPFAPGGAAEARKATLTILLTDRGTRPRKQPIENNIRKALENLPGARTKVGLGGSGEKYVIMLTGEDPLALSQAAAALEKDLRTIPGLGSVASSAALVRPEVSVRPDFAKMADLGVTSAAIGETLRIATVGDYDQALAKLNVSSRQIPIVVRLDDAARSDLSQIERLTMPGSQGPVMLGQVAQIELSGGPAVIDRFNRQRNVQFEVELSGVALGDVTAKVAELPAIKELPPGVRQVEIGDAEVMAELFASFGLAMLTGVLCIYIVLVLLFKAFLQPITILMALPLSLGGAFIGLLIAQKSFSMPSLIGLIMLMGVATKNSILLVDYAIIARREGMARWDAIMDACHKRARPIVMTTIAMGAGMLPIALSWGGSDQSFRSPMAVAVIGGLITSTFLSLLVIPAVFTFVDDFAQGISGAWWAKIKGKFGRNK
ncbi:MAG: efflux RND transporter permease subunit, partial [Brachymonas sp.]|nr:efflux RND transporter permease subunit [Brachymonas sp.]